MATVALKSYEFRRERERGWRQLETLVAKAERSGLDALSGEELMRLPMLYRGALSALSVARAISLDRALLDYLEALCQRAYVQVYGTRRHLREALVDFFAYRFPAAVRGMRWPVALAGAILVLSAVAGHLLTTADAERFYSLVPAEMAQGRDPGASTEYLRSTLYAERSGDEDSLTAFAAFLFTHNAKVGMLCFALGFAAGAPVFLLLAVTGLMLGGFSALFVSRGLGPDLWGWLLPHGVTELLAVVLCGGAGFVLAHRLIFPGTHRRLVSLARGGREAGVVVLGCVVMFLIAGLIEGFFRQLVHDMTVRYGLAIASAMFWAWYFGFVGRSRESR